MRFRRIDVRPAIARGEEPFPVILRELGGLAPGEGLELIAPFLPSPLIERLGADGFAHRIEHAPGEPWRVYFWRDAGAG